ASRAGAGLCQVCSLSPPHWLSEHREPRPELAGAVEPVGEAARPGAPAFPWRAAAARARAGPGPDASGVVAGRAHGGALGRGDPAGGRHDSAPGPGHHRAAHRARHGRRLSSRPAYYRAAPGSAIGGWRARGNPQGPGCGPDLLGGGVSAVAMLEVRDIHTYYGDSYVLQGVSLKADRGTVVAVLGRNGVGKTTLIRSIIGFTPPRRGQLWFKGVNITHMPSYHIAQMGMGIIPQGRRIFPSLSVRENLDIATRPPNGTVRQGKRWTLERVLGLFPRLEERLQHPGRALSGGEQQMLASA